MFNSRTELEYWSQGQNCANKIIRIRVCGFVCVYVCVPLTIDYWTQRIITNKNRKQYSTVQIRIRIRECSSLWQNWSIKTKDRTVQTNNQNTRLCPSVWLCVCLCLCALNNRLLDPRTNNQQKTKTVQYSSDQNQKIFKTMTELEYWNQWQNCAESRLKIENDWNIAEIIISTVQIRNKIIIGPTGYCTVQIRPELDITETFAQYSTVEIGLETKYQNQTFSEHRHKWIGNAPKILRSNRQVPRNTEHKLYKSIRVEWHTKVCNENK